MNFENRYYLILLYSKIIFDVLSVNFLRRNLNTSGRGTNEGALVG
jgi:hypothetical protein